MVPPARIVRGPRNLSDMWNVMEISWDIITLITKVYLVFVARVYAKYIFIQVLGFLNQQRAPPCSNQNPSWAFFSTEERLGCRAFSLRVSLQINKYVWLFHLAWIHPCLIQNRKKLWFKPCQGCIWYQMILAKNQEKQSWVWNTPHLCKQVKLYWASYSKL